MYSNTYLHKLRAVLLGAILIAISGAGYYLLRERIGLQSGGSQTNVSVPAVIIQSPPAATTVPEMPHQAASSSKRTQAIVEYYKKYFEFPADKRPEPGSPNVPFKMSKSLLTLGAKSVEHCKTIGLAASCGWNDLNIDLFLASREGGDQLTLENTGLTVKEVDDYVDVTLNVSGVAGEERGLNTIRYKMLEEDGEWRIDDVILSDSLSLRGMMTTKTPAELLQLGIHYDMTFNDVLKTLEKKGYRIDIEDADGKADPDLPRGLSCGQGLDAICSAGFTKSADQGVSLVFKQGKMGWVLTGSY